MNRRRGLGEEEEDQAHLADGAVLERRLGGVALRLLPRVHLRAEETLPVQAAEATTNKQTTQERGEEARRTVWSG
jgi:hypothetical protein